MLSLIAIILLVLIGVICSTQFRDRIGDLYDVFLVFLKWTWIFIIWAGAVGLIVFLIYLIYGWCISHTKEFVSDGRSIAVLIIIVLIGIANNRTPLKHNNSGGEKVKKCNSIQIPNLIGWIIIGSVLVFFLFVFYLVVK